MGKERNGMILFQVGAKEKDEERVLEEKKAPLVEPVALGQVRFWKRDEKFVIYVAGDHGLEVWRNREAI